MYDGTVVNVTTGEVAPAEKIEEEVFVPVQEITGGEKRAEKLAMIERKKTERDREAQEEKERDEWERGRRGAGSGARGNDVLVVQSNQHCEEISDWLRRDPRFSSYKFVDTDSLPEDREFRFYDCIIYVTHAGSARWSDSISPREDRGRLQAFESAFPVTVNIYTRLRVCLFILS